MRNISPVGYPGLCKDVARAVTYVAVVGGATSGLLAYNSEEYVLPPQTPEPVTPLIMPDGSSKKTSNQTRNHPDHTYITGEPSGYVIGKASKNDTIAPLHNDISGNYQFGAINVNGYTICGWVDSGVLRVKKQQGKTINECMSLYGQKDRDQYGKDFNCGVAKCVSGAETKLEPECDRKLYGNFASSKTSRTNMDPRKQSGFHSFIGKVANDTIGYRYTYRYASKPDGAAVMVSTPEYGWGFMRSSCVTPVSGGAKKYSNTTPGLKPNANRQTSSAYPTKPLKKAS